MLLEVQGMMCVRYPNQDALPACWALAVRWALPACLTFAAISAASCSPDRTRLGPVDGGDEEFTLGPATIYPVQVEGGGAVADSISGGAFAFPAGGNGTLTVARIVDSPLAPPEGASGFSVEYTGEEPMELRLERTEESIPLLWAYGFGDVSPSEPMTAENTWWAMMPEDTTSNPAVFLLAPPGKPDDVLARTMGANVAGSGAGGVATPCGGEPRFVNVYKFMARRVAPGSNVWEFRKNMQALTKFVVQALIAGLPPDLRAHARSEVDGRLAFRSYELMFAYQSSSYSAFTYPLGNFGVRYRRLYPMMHYVWTGPNAANQGTVAHEVGHYMNHVFFGDDAFEAFSDAQLITNHDFGFEHPRRDMLEEYAMFADYFVNDEVRGGIDVTEPIPQLQKSASIVDYPALEGYACCLLARMIVERDSIINSEALKDDIPTVGASFADMFDILYTKKPTTVNALRAELALFLAGRNQADRLPAILERSGWSYNGTGMVVDGDSNPVEGAEVQSVCKVASQGGREYFAPLEPVVTNVNGYFTLPRIFPGTNTIRVKTELAEQEFVYTIDPNDPTDRERSIGALRLEDSLLGLLHQLRYVAVSTEGVFTLSDGNELWTLVEPGHGYGHQGTWTGTEFVLQSADSTVHPSWVNGVTVRFTINVSASGLQATRLQCHIVHFTRIEGRLDNTTTIDFDIDEIPHTVTYTEDPGRRFVWFELDGAAIDANLRTVSRVESYLNPPRQITLTNADWTREGQEGHVRINFLERLADAKAH